MSDWRIENLICATLDACGSLTADELVDHTGLELNAILPALTVLVDEGMLDCIVYTGGETLYRV